MTRDDHDASTAGGSDPGRDLICALIGEQARGQHCRTCGQMLGNCKVTVRVAAPDRLDAAVICRSCGATNSVTVRPAAGEGTADLE